MIILCARKFRQTRERDLAKNVNFDLVLILTMPAFSKVPVSLQHCKASHPSKISSLWLSLRLVYLEKIYANHSSGVATNYVHSHT